MVEQKLEVIEAAAAAHPRFAAAARSDSPDLLALTATVAEGLDPFDWDYLHRQLDFLAFLVDRANDGSADPHRRLAALRQVLGEEEGFVGNHDDYANPTNSYLQQVLDRKLGLPISLSVIYLLVAERLEWPLIGIDFPNHFLLRYQEADELLVIDPYHGGERIELNRCVELARPAYADIARQQLLLLVRLRLESAAAPSRIASRMLKNLETRFLAHRDYPAARNVIEKLLLLDPEASFELRDLGGIYHLLGDHRRAVCCLRGYLAGAPKATDRPQVEEMLARLDELLGEGGR